MPKCVNIEQLLADKLLEMMKDTPFYKIKVTDLRREAGVHVYMETVGDLYQELGV